MTGKRLLCMVVVLLTLLIQAPPLAAQENMARMRIGYFAFDPREHDTFIDGELVSFNDAWDFNGWSYREPPNEFVCCSSTPYTDFRAGAHEFVFAPAGQGIAAALGEPQAVSFVAGHVHTVAIIGELDDGSLKILNVDHNEYAAGMDYDEVFFQIIANDLAGSHESMLTYNGDSIPYGGYVVYPDAAAETGTPIHFELVGDPNQVLMDTQSVSLAPGLSDLSVFSGTYPGDLGQDYALHYNWAYAGDVNVVEAGSVVSGDSLTGEVTEIAQRVRYILILDSDTILNIYVQGGSATESRPYLWPGGDSFDPMVYVYDDQERLRYWNDDLVLFTDFNAGFSGLSLPAGTYFVEVGAGADAQAGTYTIEVATAE